MGFPTFRMCPVRACTYGLRGSKRFSSLTLCSLLKLVGKDYLIVKLVRPSGTLNKHFSHGRRNTCALLTRLRIGTCSLNHSLFICNLVPSAACNCGCRTESVVQVFFHIALPTNNIKIDLVGNLQNISSNTLNFNRLSESVHIHLLLRVSPFLSFHTNADLYCTYQTLQNLSSMTFICISD